MITRTITRLPVESLLCPPQVRTRFEDEKQRQLTASIAADGLQQPVRVGPANGQGMYPMLDGERRLRSFIFLGIPTIEAIIEDAQRTPVDVVIQALVANCQRESLSPIDLAHAIRILMTDGKMTAGEAAKRLHFSPPTVTRTLSLLTLPEDAQEHIHQGRIAASTGYAIARVRNPTERARLIVRALKGDLTRDGASLASRRRAGARTANPKGIVFPLGGSWHLTVAGNNLSLSELCGRLGELVARLNALAGSVTSIEEAARMLAANAGPDLEGPPPEAGSV